MKTWTEQELRPMILAAAQKYGLDPTMFYGQLKHESANFAPAVLAGKRRSSAGAIGIAQFMPGTAAGLGIDPLNVPEAIDAGAKYMAQLKTKFNDDEGLARLAYNWGPGNTRKWVRQGADPAKLPKETREYTTNVAKAAGVDPEGTQLAAVKPLPTGVKPSQAGAGRGLVAPAAVLASATQSMTAGLPFEVASEVVPPAEPAYAAAPANDWRAAVTGGAARSPSLVPGVDFAEMLQDQVANRQDAVLAGMFADAGAAAPKDTSSIPKAVDRFLDQVLA